MRTYCRRHPELPMFDRNYCPVCDAEDSEPVQVSWFKRFMVWLFGRG